MEVFPQYAIINIPVKGPVRGSAEPPGGRWSGNAIFPNFAVISHHSRILSTS